MVATLGVPEHPGPAPVAPLVPFEAWQRLAASLGALIDELARARRVHEDAFGHITDDVFVGAAADAFRWALAGQLRRSSALEALLHQDLEHVRTLIARGQDLARQHEVAMARWQRAVSEHHQAVLSIGRGPIAVPGDAGAAWVRPRGLP
jgi:hypothetical protein